MTLHEIEDSLTRSLTTITTHWPHMLTPRSSGSIARGSTATVTLADDHSDTDADTPRLERLLSLRREVTDCLNGWTRVIIEDRNITTTAPHGTDTLAMCAFITTHARWFSGHEAAGDAAAELRGWAGKVKSTVDPERKDWVNIGTCPITVDADGAPTECGAKIRAYPHKDTITCTRCGTEGNVAWWEHIIMPDTSRLVTAAELPEFVRQQFGKTIKQPTVRKWIERHVITAAGTDEKGRTLYDKGAVAYALARRQVAL